MGCGFKLGGDTFFERAFAPRKGVALLFGIVTLTCAPAFAQFMAGPEPGPLRVATDARRLDREDGTPFFWLSDDASAIVQRLDRADIAHYLDETAKQGFTVVQVTALSDHQPLDRANPRGDVPLEIVEGRPDPARPARAEGTWPDDALEYDYWDHLDYLFDEAAKRRLFVALEPTAAGHVCAGAGTGATGEALFSVRSARAYGRFLGRRSGDRRNVVWLVGGTPADSNARCRRSARGIWREIVEGLAEGFSGRSVSWTQRHEVWSRLVIGARAWSSDAREAAALMRAPWVDLVALAARQTASELAGNSITGAGLAKKAHKPIVALTPAPALDAVATSAQDHERLGRATAYEHLFAGAAGWGHAHASLARMLTEGPTTWKDALKEPSRARLAHARRLLETLRSPARGRLPDPELLVAGRARKAKAPDRGQALRAPGGEDALVYSREGRPLEVRLDRLAAGLIDAFWYDPRTGQRCDDAGRPATAPFAQHRSGPGAQAVTFDPPGEPAAGNDWVLELVHRREPSAR